MVVFLGSILMAHFQNNWNKKNKKITLNKLDNDFVKKSFNLSVHLVAFSLELPNLQLCPVNQKLKRIKIL